MFYKLHKMLGWWGGRLRSFSLVLSGISSLEITVVNHRCSQDLQAAACRTAVVNSLASNFTS